MTEADQKVIQAMIRFGGSFVSNLGKAALCADANNLQKDKRRFPGILAAVYGDGQVMKCPSCATELEKASIEGRRNIYRCPKENTLYRLKTKRKPKSDFDINDSSTWHATCVECGNKKMEYYNFKYHCPNPKCGHILYV